MTEPIVKSAIIKIDYTNYRGKREIRTIEPFGIFFGENKWHEGAQWFIIASARDRGSDVRVFALRNIHQWDVK